MGQDAPQQEENIRNTSVSSVREYLHQLHITFAVAVCTLEKLHCRNFSNMHSHECGNVAAFWFKCPNDTFRFRVLIVVVCRQSPSNVGFGMYFYLHLNRLISINFGTSFVSNFGILILIFWLKLKLLTRVFHFLLFRYWNVDCIGLCAESIKIVQSSKTLFSIFYLNQCT